MTEQNIISVSQVNEYIKARMDQDSLLNFLCVRGEISNYKHYPSGHHYFSLKDAGGSLRCVMFKSSAARLRFRPENGAKVLAFGRITVFPRDGAYQLYCEQLSLEGAGDLFAAFERLKGKLQDEGLFDRDHKKPIPQYPERIAIITSSAGAAIHDMLRIIGKRYPLSKVILLPVRVQGAEAPAELCGAIKYANRHRIADVIITGRGGGSMEDLWAFNDERLAYTIYQSEIPVISAVGHEPDVTISDYVADLRAATPSNAAELAVPDQMELRERLQSLQGRMQQAAMRQIKIARQQILTLRSSRALKSPLHYLQECRMQLDHQHKQLIRLSQYTLEEKRSLLARLVASLDAMSPLKVLARGYSVTKRSGDIVTRALDLNVGDQITIMLHEGSVGAAVTSIAGGEADEF